MKRAKTIIFNNMSTANSQEKLKKNCTSYTYDQSIRSFPNTAIFNQETSYNHLENFSPKSPNFQQKKQNDKTYSKLDLIKNETDFYNIDENLNKFCKLDLLKNLSFQNETNVQKCKLDLLNEYNFNEEESLENISKINSTEKQNLFNYKSFKNKHQKTFDFQNNSESFSTLEDSLKKKEQEEIQKSKLLEEKKKFETLFQKGKIKNTKNNDKIVCFNLLENKNLKKNTISFDFLGKKEDIKIKKNKQTNIFEKLIRQKTDNISPNNSLNFSQEISQINFDVANWENIKEKNLRLREELEWKKGILNSLKLNYQSKNDNFIKNTKIQFQIKVDKLKKYKNQLILDIEKKKNEIYLNNKKYNLNDKNIEEEFFKVLKNSEQEIENLKTKNFKLIHLLENFEKKIKNKSNEDIFLEKLEKKKFYENQIKELKSFFIQDFYKALIDNKIKAKRLKQKLDKMKNINSKLMKDFNCKLG